MEGRLWTLFTYLHAFAGPATMLLYPLYESVIAMETTSKLDDEQWLAYWILYSFLTLVEMLLQPILDWIPIWYDIKLAFVAWLVLPQFRGAAYIYEKFVRERLFKNYGGVALHQTNKLPKLPKLPKLSKSTKSPNSFKNKFVNIISPKKRENGAT